MPRKKQSGGGGGGAPAWMATYSDLVTLLFALFVMMFAFSTIDAARVEAMAQAMRGGGGGGARRVPQVSANFGGEGINNLIGNGITNMPIATLVASEDDAVREARAHRQQELNQMAAEFRTYFADRNLQEAVIVQEGESYVLLRFADGVLFDSGRADLRPEALEALGAIASQLEGMDDIEIMIEGHTDNVPISTARFRDNLDLSQARSAEVWRYFVNVRGMDPTSIGAIGLSEYRPIADNATPEGRQANRRVEMRIMSGNSSANIARAMYSIP